MKKYAVQVTEYVKDYPEPVNTEYLDSLELANKYAEELWQSEETENVLVVEGIYDDETGEFEEI